MIPVTVEQYDRNFCKWENFANKLSWFCPNCKKNPQNLNLTKISRYTVYLSLNNWLNNDFSWVTLCCVGLWVPKCVCLFLVVLYSTYHACFCSWHVCSCTSVQDGLNAVHLAACGGHLSLVRELVDTHHASVHQTTKVQQPCKCCASNCSDGGNWSSSQPALDLLLLFCHPAVLSSNPILPSCHPVSTILGGIREDIGSYVKYLWSLQVGCSILQLLAAWKNCSPLWCNGRTQGDVGTADWQVQPVSHSEGWCKLKLYCLR